MVFLPNEEKKEVTHEFLGIMEPLEQVSELSQHYKWMYSHF